MPWMSKGSALFLAVLTWPATSRADEACLTSYESAQRLRLESKLVRAKQELIACARAGCPQVLRKDCTSWLAEVDKALPSVVIAASAGPAEVTEARLFVDGQLVAQVLDGSELVLDPGPHLFRLERAGSPARELKLTLRAGEKSRLVEVDFGGEPDAPKPLERTRPSLLPAYAFGALGAVALGSFAYFGLKSHSERNDLEDCKGHCPSDDVDRVRAQQLVADISLGVGVVSLALAGWFYFGATPEQPASAWRLGVRPLPNGGAAALGARF